MFYDMNILDEPNKTKYIIFFFRHADVFSFDIGKIGPYRAFKFKAFNELFFEERLIKYCEISCFCTTFNDNFLMF